MDETTLGFGGEHCECCMASQATARMLSNALNEKPPVVGKASTYLKVCLLQWAKNTFDSAGTFFGGLVSYWYEVYQTEKHKAGTDSIESAINLLKDPTELYLNDVTDWPCSDDECDCHADGDSKTQVYEVPDDVDLASLIDSLLQDDWDESQGHAGHGEGDAGWGF